MSNIVSPKHISFENVITGGRIIIYIICYHCAYEDYDESSGEAVQEGETTGCALCAGMV